MALVLCLSPSRLLNKSSEDGGDKLRPLKVVSFTDVWSIEQDSPEIGTSNPCPVSKPDITQACLSYSPSLEGWCRECYKLPNGAVVIQECLSDVNRPTARLKPDQGWAVSAARRPGLELVWQVLKPPDRMAVQRPLNKVVVKHELRRGHSHSPNGVQLILSFPVFCCLHTAVEIGPQG